MSGFSHQRGKLHADQVPLDEIAAAYGTPTYVYSESQIRQAYTEFDDAFGSIDHLVCYSVKANSNLAILSLLASMGAGFDIVSGGELQRVIRAGGDPAKTVFSGVGKTADEVTEALEAGIACFNIESEAEFETIEQIARQRGLTARVSFRVNPDVDAGTHPYIATGLKENKFGVDHQLALDLYQRAAASEVTEIVGVDCHIGSQITDLAPITDAFALVLELVDKLSSQGIHLEHIDLGGGLGVRYQDEHPIPVETYASALIQMMGSRPQSLFFEPGRYITADAGVLLTRVILNKTNQGRRFTVVDAAMNDLIRPALYQSWQLVSDVTSGGESTLTSVVGPICETGDFLARDRELVAEAGDLVAIHSAGAYGFVMSSNYNSRNRAAEVLVSGDRHHCIRRRETIDDQLVLESTPEWDT